ncbi:hypothetical protein IE81DRAFT_322256 [Ceraceosorus guamensis]|uniref:Aromatic amino acid beta-eliminating lyase/threonine aldolase domain-containing protein n=1 Tax=Ceraceosorus guamensis TaxID=1522189 RepID=A0A316W3C4_9BASI|nr:hypothetical protein IE81DRAFT_322256 [Ceraceosorus guamensis]PWN43598.1 hypothetical protein IE81DRAFT_322256 [Ceraceosorus guamensis]
MPALSTRLASLPRSFSHPAPTLFRPRLRSLHSMTVIRAPAAPSPTLGPSLVFPAIHPRRQELPDNEAKLATISRDLRSDTLTVPTDSMFQAMQRASRGDDVYLEDETTTSFEAEMAALAGKEAALFVVSGTLSNQLAIRTHLQQPPYSVLCDRLAHIQRYEAGGVAFHSGALVECVQPRNDHHLTWQDDILPNLVLGDDVHSAPTRLICLENTLHGRIFPQEEIIRIAKGAAEHDIKLHCDGARLWNVAAETGKSIEELCRPFDSVSMCLSKGIGAPVGTVLVGTAPFIRKARHFRKLFGAGIRQSGSLAAAARTGLSEHFPKLRATHQLARFAADELEKLGVAIVGRPETCMLFIDTAHLGFSLQELQERAAQLPKPIRLGAARIVIHHQTSAKAIEDLIDLVRSLREEFAHRAYERESGSADGAPRAQDGGNLYAAMSKSKHSRQSVDRV